MAHLWSNNYAVSSRRVLLEAGADLVTPIIHGCDKGALALAMQRPTVRCSTFFAL